MKTTFPTFSKSSRFFKHFLKALGGATVSTLSLLSLCITSAQAASFVTTFETNDGNVTLEWSGEDANQDGTIDGTELSGSWTVRYDGEKTLDLGDGENFSNTTFEYNIADARISIDRIFVGTNYSGLNFGTNTVWNTDDFIVYVDDYSGIGSRVFGKNYLGISTQTIDDATEADYPTPAQPAAAATTPEPALTLGLIALGGLMLGSKRKTKG